MDDRGTPREKEGGLGSNAALRVRLHHERPEQMLRPDFSGQGRTARQRQGRSQAEAENCMDRNQTPHGKWVRIRHASGPLNYTDHGALVRGWKSADAPDCRDGNDRAARPITPVRDRRWDCVTMPDHRRRADPCTDFN
ncbi:MAG: hypothetical protein AMXMBFR67_02540 [Nitrospira sp.]